MKKMLLFLGWFVCTALAIVLTVPLYYKVLVPYVNGTLYFSLIMVGMMVYTYHSMKLFDNPRKEGI